MKIPLLKLNREKLPKPEALRPPVFDSAGMWFKVLGASLLIFLATAFLGGKIFYSQYFESYKKSDSSENFESLINTKSLTRAVEQRSSFVNQEPLLPRDPSR